MARRRGWYTPRRPPTARVERMGQLAGRSVGYQEADINQAVRVETKRQLGRVRRSTAGRKERSEKQEEEGGTATVEFEDGRVSMPLECC